MVSEAFLGDLDPDQYTAVTTDSLLVAVIAGAGSGKTRVLTRRIAHRVAGGTADARHTLALTFTREAASELRRRLFSLGLRDRVETGTFHSVMLGVLKQRWADTDRPPLTVVADRGRLVKESLDAVDRKTLEAIIAEIDWASARAISADSYAAIARRTGRHPIPGIDRCADAIAAYQLTKQRRGVLDFDDVLSRAIEEMRGEVEFASSLRWRFRHLHVDEAQDLNPLQHRIIDFLRGDRNDLFLVGDPAQAIYGFNGADPGLLTDVEQRFEGIEVIRLPTNHRSVSEVVSTGAHILGIAGQPIDAVARRGAGSGVQLLVGKDERDEATLIAAAIGRIDPYLVRRGGVCVLARTHAQLNVIEEALNRSNLPVHRRQDHRSPRAAAVRTAASLGSASLLRGWAHDTLDDITESPGREDERSVAAAVLDFLRETPLGDGVGFRSWVATTAPFDDATGTGVELTTFHGSKGREWHTAVVAGVEKGLSPHSSATTAPGRDEEARLLFVAVTRATDHLIISRAERRGGYQRAASPFIADLDLGQYSPVAPPPRVRTSASHDVTSENLQRWRADAARRANVLPSELCSDRDLRAIATHRPTTPSALAEVTTFGPLTAQRLSAELADVLSRQDRQ